MGQHDTRPCGHGNTKITIDSNSSNAWKPVAASQANLMAQGMRSAAVDQGPAF